MHDVLVVGAGLAGLSCAFELHESGADLCVVDAQSGAGGVVGTDRIEAANGDSFLFERGPNTVQASSRRFRELCGRVGIADRLIASSDEAKRRYLYSEGALRELPSGPLSFFKSDVLSGSAKRRMASEPLRKFKARAAGSPESTLQEFFEERIGEEATRKLAGAFVRGIYAAELSELGIQSAFPRLHELCVQHGGLVRGMIGMRRAAKRAPLPPAPGPEVRRTALLSFPEGLGELPRALAANLNGRLGERLRTGFRVDSLERTGETWRVLGAGEALEARRLVLAVPAPVAAALLEKIAPTSAESLRSISHGRLTLIHQGFSAGKTPLPLPAGFGFLVPPADPKQQGVKLKVLGTIFGSNCFDGRAPQGGATTTQFYRTSDLPVQAESADSTRHLTPTAAQQTLLQTAHRELTNALGNEFPEPAAWRIQRWDDVIPRYAPGHTERVMFVRAELKRCAPGLSIIGNYTDGVSVENVVGSGVDEAVRILAEGNSS